ncbi:MAG: DUF1553 domain-containing protein, partial [Candidatus Solibacter sp.]
AAYFSNEEQLRLYRCDIAQEEYVSAGFLFPELDRPLASMAPADRRAAAAAIFTDPRNGRMPRTVVNRIWRQLMGRGIVENVDEMDGEPWSPELLDWLASDFVANGYDLRALISTILQSRTYQIPAVARKGGAEPQYTFRGPEVRRLSAEQFSDAVASITGEWHALPGRAAPPPGAVASAVRPPVIISGAPSEGAGLPAARIVVPTANPVPAPIAPPPGPVAIPPGRYTRSWRIAGSSLERALGRPIRDQVYGTRDTQATTIQALELVNGEALTHWLWRGARRMLGELPAEPVSLIARQANIAGRGLPPPTPANGGSTNAVPVPAGGGRGAPAPFPFEVDISQSNKLYLVVQDSLSTAPDKAAPLWVQPEFVGPNGITPLSALKPLDRYGLREDTSAISISGITEGEAPALRVKLSSVVVYDIAGKGFTRFKAAPGHEATPLTQGETVQARFYVFGRQPAMDRLVPPNPETPLPPDPALKTVGETVERVYWYALGRAPAAVERRVAEAALRDAAHPQKPSADGLADFLWSVLMTPEFQLVR